MWPYVIACICLMLIIGVLYRFFLHIMKDIEKTQIKRAEQEYDFKKMITEGLKDALFTWSAIVCMKDRKTVYITKKDYISFDLDRFQYNVIMGRDTIIKQLNDPYSMCFVADDPSELYLKSNIESIKFKKFNDKELT